jgi:hypothetical protein
MIPERSALPEQLLASGGRLLDQPPAKPNRHFERSKPTFSSRFAPANRSAYEERNLSSILPL